MSRPEVPDTLARRPWDERRNLPVPVVSVFPDGQVNFAAINSLTGLQLSQARKCGLCGETMGYWVAFLGGPKAAEMGSYGDPPMHPECASAAVRLCPHIAVSHHRRVSDARQAQLAAGESVTVPDGWLEDKPSEWVLYVTREYDITLAPSADGGQVPIYLPRPAKSLRRFRYDTDGHIEEIP